METQEKVKVKADENLIALRPDICSACWRIVEYRSTSTAEIRDRDLLLVGNHQVKERHGTHLDARRR